MRRLLGSGLSLMAFLSLAVVLGSGLTALGYAAWTDAVHFSSTVTVAKEELGGTPGFWKNWDRHATYSQSQIVAFLLSIDSNSGWLVADMNNNGYVDIIDMEKIFDAGEHGTMQDRFLRQYLATRLNLESGRLLAGTIHDFRSCDPDNYFGLDGAGTLEQIVEAIESKYGTAPIDDEYEVMKNVCDALNNVEIGSDYGWGPSEDDQTGQAAATTRAVK